MKAIDWLSNFFESLTVLGWAIFVISVIIYLFASALYVMRRGGDREAWFVVGIVGIFLGLGLRYGLPYSTELLAGGIRGSLVWVPEIQASVKDAFGMAVEPWQRDGITQPEPTLTISAGDVTIVATGGIPPTPVIATPTSTPEAPTSTPNGVGSGEPPPTLTNEQAATAIVIQQLTATYTPLPSVVPTLDMSNWNPQTPAPTRRPGG